MRHISLMITGASATGKSSVVKTLMSRGFVRLAGVTTRPKRRGEIEGVDFFYISKEEFLSRFANGEYCDPNIEVTKYNDEYYGSPTSWINFSSGTCFVFFTHYYRHCQLDKESKKTECVLGSFIC